MGRCRCFRGEGCKLTLLSCLLQQHHICGTLYYMNKSEVYSWRVSPEVKNGLEAAARAHKTSVAQLLDQIVSQWLDREEAGDETQDQLHQAAMQTFGTIRGGDPLRSQQVGQRVRTRLQQRRVG